MEHNKKVKTPKMWHNQHEVILKGWGESCACYRYLHYKAYQEFKQSNMRFTLPIIVISTITGTANFAQETFPLEWRDYVPAVIGAFNLLAAILTTIAQFLKVSELLESHRVSSIHYGKLARSIRLELTLPISERAHDGSSMVDICRSEYDRLIEQSPPIPGGVLRVFDSKYRDKNVTMPEIITVRAISPYDGRRESMLEAEVVAHFKEKIRPPIGKAHEVIHELESLKAKGLVSRKKPPDQDTFYDIEAVEEVNDKPQQDQVKSEVPE